MIKVVIYPQIFYWLQSFYVPRQVLVLLEKLIRGFLRKGKPSERDLVVVSWNKVG